MVEPMAQETDDEMEEILQEAIEKFDCVAGTLHWAEGDHLHLVAHEGMPDSVLENIQAVPVGKGMAGLAADRREPIQVSNLQTDDSGVAEPRARDTGMEGSVAAPVITPDGTLKGAIGVAKPEAYEFTSEECDQLMAMGEQVAHRL
jgi:L-methionine (R)-S-oxide reductase